MLKAIRRAVLVGLLTAAVPASAAAHGYVVSVGDKTTLMYGWENRFAIEWTTDPDTPQTRIVRGFVSARSGLAADRMRVLIQASDAAGHALAQHIVYLPTGVNGAGPTYFEEPGMPIADQYRVTVWDYTTIESIGNLR